MSEIKRYTDNKAMVEGWPDPEPEDDFDTFEEDEDDWYNDVDAAEPLDYEIRFKLKGATKKEISWINRYLFDALSKELDIPYDKFEDLEIEED